MPRQIPLDKELPNAAGDPSRIPLPALMELAVDAMWTDFRASLLEAGITDIRPTHGCVFRFLHGDGMRLTELASLAGLTKQSVGEIVDDLTALGYIERYPDPTDKRAKLLRLTKQGQGRPGDRLQPLLEARIRVGGGLRRGRHRRPPRPAGTRRDRQSPRRRPRDRPTRRRSGPLIR